MRDSPGGFVLNIRSTIQPGYVQGRPSAAGAGYDAAGSSGSNLGMTSKKLADRVVVDEARLKAENPDARGPIPAALLAASASGLDPHLPPEAAQTVELIDAGGPFLEPDHDGGTFGNREELLPDRPMGYYREYTVPTPGSEDRGARRIVAGDDEELYWTDDHYGSFARIER